MRNQEDIKFIMLKVNPDFRTSGLSSPPSSPPSSHSLLCQHYCLLGVGFYCLTQLLSLTIYWIKRLVSLRLFRSFSSITVKYFLTTFRKECELLQTRSQSEIPYKS